MAKKTRKVTNIELSGDAVVAFETLQRITKRTPEEVVSDAFNTDLLVIFELMVGSKGRKILANHPKGDRQKMLKGLVKNVSTAGKYFKAMEWM